MGMTAEIEQALDDLKELASVDLHDYIDFQFLPFRLLSTGTPRTHSGASLLLSRAPKKRRPASVLTKLGHRGVTLL